MGGYQFQEFQFDRDLDPVWLRSRRQQQRRGGQAAHRLCGLWEREVLSRIKLTEPSDSTLLFRKLAPSPKIKKLTLVARITRYRVDVEVKAWEETWGTVLIGGLSHDQANPFLTRGKIRIENYREILPLAIRHIRYANAALLERTELKCILAGQMPDLKLV